MNTSHRISLAVLAVAVVTCTACGSADKPTTPGPALTSTTSSQATASATDTPMPKDYPFSQAPGPQAPETEVPQPGASWSTAAESDALATATKAMGYFAHPDSGEPKWFDDLKPFLTPDAAESLSYTDPQNVPVHAVKGAGTLVKDPTNPFGAVVEFSTDAGTYSVQVVRSGDAAPWQVAAIAPVGNK